MAVLETTRVQSHALDGLLGAGPAPRFAGDFQPTTFFPVGAQIYAQGELSAGLYRVDYGAVRVYRLLSDGRRQIAAFYLTGELFGFEAGHTRHFFAEAVCATGVQALRAAGRRDLAAELLPAALEGLARAQEHLLLLGRQNAVERIAAFLLDMSERQGGPRQVDLPMSRQDIADYLGLTIETVSRTLSSFRREGVIGLPSLRRVEIARPQLLRGLAA